MKLRLVAVFLILFVAAWLPSIAQQSPAPQSTTPPAQPAVKSDPSSASGCHGKDGSPQSMASCEGKHAKDMPCCHKNAPGKQAKANCCDAQDGKTCCAKDAKLCAKNGKDCCAGPDCTSRCDKSTAAN